ncbi:MAG: FAD-dependent oxidoreductase, partial [Mariprofundaceae bacterium]|nr:FAD-dependent oxidoreductase [Mariprofundaceae bacterium]
MKGGRKRIAIIGGGLCGLTCAIRLAEYDFDIEIFEAAPMPGGRTRSFFDTHIHQWVDNGPHLLAGAYRHTQRLLQEAGADQHIHWQPSLELPLWDHARGYFQLAPNRYIPLALAMPWACLRLPGHHAGSATALLRLAMGNRKSIGGADIDDRTTVHDWLRKIDVPRALARDLLEPLCLGIMNESMQTANAKSFSRVLREAFDSHASARLGWFTQPLSKAMVEPLVQLAESRGVHIHTTARVRKMNVRDKQVHINTGDACKTYDIAVMALPARARNHLLNEGTGETETRCITNIHLWFADVDAL